MYRRYSQMNGNAASVSQLKRSRLKDLLILALTVYNLVLAQKGLKVKYTVCLIGGLPSDEYFRMKEDGVSELEIRRKMVEALTVMQNEARAKEAVAEADALRKRAEHK